MAAIFRSSCAARGLARLALWFAVFHEVIMNAPAVHWDILKQDLRYTARTLNRARGFALTAILVTALAWAPIPRRSRSPISCCCGPALCRPPTPGPPVRRTAHRRRMGLHERALAGQLSRLQRARRSKRWVPSRGARSTSWASVSRGVSKRAGRPKCFRCSVCSRRSDASSTDARTIAARRSSAMDCGNRSSQATRRCWGERCVSTACPHGHRRHAAAFYFPTRESQLWTMLTFRDEDFADRTNNYIHGV